MLLFFSTTKIPFIGFANAGDFQILLNTNRTVTEAGGNCIDLKAKICPMTAVNLL